MPFRLSQRVTLHEGDRVRVSGGPYFLAQSGNKISMGERGVGTFVGVEENGMAIFVQFGHGAARRVYIGPETVSEVTGTILRPHKVVKMRVSRCK
jgi:hypothetical protein